MAAQESDKTEPATPKRKEDARKQGQVAQSRDLPGVTILGTALLAGGSFVGLGLLEAVALQARAAWGGLAAAPHSLGDFHAALLHHGGTVALAALPLLLLLAAVALLTQLAQVGPMLSLEALQPKGERMDPFKGLRRMVSMDRVVELAKAVLKIVLVVGVAAWVVRDQIASVLVLSGASISTSFEVSGSLARQVGIAALSALAVLAAFDVAWQRFSHEKKLRMSKQEVRDELKQREGSPQTRSRFRARQQELTRQRMIAAVPEADVVITNPTEYAVALRYEQGRMAAPKVLAKGRGFVARRIREVAVAAGVAIVEDPPLARSLHRSVEVGRDVPEALYQAVAEVLAYVYRLRPARHRGWTPAS